MTRCAIAILTPTDRERVWELKRKCYSRRCHFTRSHAQKENAKMRWELKWVFNNTDREAEGEQADQEHRDS